ncbi:MAG: extracellular solute-binding protein, partial [Bacilli bacterium]|nr:extracellular solute-binding protein [Bacilli bacterium]
MKKSKFMLCVSAAMLLASCGGQPSTGASSGESKASGASTETSQATSVSTEESKASVSSEAYVPTEAVELKIWCAEAAVDLTTSQINDFIKACNWSDKVTFEVEAVGEGDAATKVVTDVDAAADVYFFAQDQLSRLVTAGGVTQLTKSYADPIKEENGDGSVIAATVGDNIYAFPATADNGYFLYYNKAALGANDIGRWDNLIAKAEEGNKKVLFNYSSAWYNFGFFYGAGADSIWTTDDEGAFVEYEDTYTSAKGLAGAMGLAKVATSPACVDSSSAGDVTDDTIAIVSGTWDYKAMSDAWGENLGCTELPSFTVGNNVYHTGSFSGNKLVGVKPQTDANKARIALDIAEYLTSEKGQIERFEELQWGPSNLAASESDAVLAAPQIAALAKQNVYA